jgi:hypothetical protein
VQRPFRLHLDIQGLGMDPRRWRVNPAARSAAGKSFRVVVSLFYIGHPILAGWKSHVLMRQTRPHELQDFFGPLLIPAAEPPL